MARDWLIKLRKEKYPNQTAASKAANIASARYSRIELGYCDIRPEEAETLARVFNVSAEMILTGNAASSQPTVARPATKPQSIPASPQIPAPRSDDLNDPKNFALQPPLALLGVAQDPAGLARLKEATIFAEKVMHTSRVRPAIWVAWRDFYRDGLATIRGERPVRSLAATPVAPPLPPIKPASQAPQPTNNVVPSNARLRGNKNVYGHFVDVARQLLSREVEASISAKATTAKAKEPEIGFMKHYRRISGEVLTADVLARLDAEASQRATGTAAVQVG